MAKGDPAGLYSPDAVSMPSTGNAILDNFVSFVVREFQKISTAFNRGLAREVEFLNKEPPRPYDGLTTGADGTNWNPGSGQGVYTYYAGAWHKLG